MSHYRLTWEAKADLRAIREHIAKDRPLAAHRLMEEFFERFRLATTHPHMGEARENLGAGYRVFSVGNYVVVFRPVKGGMQVVRVIHGARDIESLF